MAKTDCESAEAGPAFIAVVEDGVGTDLSPELRRIGPLSRPPADDVAGPLVWVRDRSRFERVIPVVPEVAPLAPDAPTPLEVLSAESSRIVGPLTAGPPCNDGGPPCGGDDDRTVAPGWGNTFDAGSEVASGIVDSTRIFGGVSGALDASIEGSFSELFAAASLVDGREDGNELVGLTDTPPLGADNAGADNGGVDNDGAVSGGVVNAGGVIAGAVIAGAVTVGGVIAGAVNAGVVFGGVGMDGGAPPTDSFRFDICGGGTEIGSAAATWRIGADRGGDPGTLGGGGKLPVLPGDALPLPGGKAGPDATAVPRAAELGGVFGLAAPPALGRMYVLFGNSPGGAGETLAG